MKKQANTTTAATAAADKKTNNKKRKLDQVADGEVGPSGHQTHQNDSDPKQLKLAVKSEN